MGGTRSRKLDSRARELRQKVMKMLKMMWCGSRRMGFASTAMLNAGGSKSAGTGQSREGPAPYADGVKRTVALRLGLEGNAKNSGFPLGVKWTSKGAKKRRHKV